MNIIKRLKGNIILSAEGLETAHRRERLTAIFHKLQAFGILQDDKLSVDPISSWSNDRVNETWHYFNSIKNLKDAKK